MKIKRYKKVHRCLSFYINNFGFRQPYQVLIDGTFCQCALQNKVNLKEQIPKYLNGEVHLFTTACVIIETEKLGPVLYGATLVVKQFQVRKCGHEKNPIAASECLYSMMKEENKDHYLLATQDPELSEKIRNTPGCPLMYLKCQTIVLEKPSIVSVTAAKVTTENKQNPSEHSLAVLQKLKQELGAQSEKKRKRKHPKGPNPLSCKKKKQRETDVVKRKRKRHQRLKVPKHVKEHLLSLKNKDM